MSYVLLRLCIRREVGFLRGCACLRCVRGSAQPTTKRTPTPPPFSKRETPTPAHGEATRGDGHKSAGQPSKSCEQANNVAPRTWPAYPYYECHITLNSAHLLFVFFQVHLMNRCCVPGAVHHTIFVTLQWVAPRQDKKVRRQIHLGDQ